MNKRPARLIAVCALCAIVLSGCGSKSGDSGDVAFTHGAVSEGGCTVLISAEPARAGAGSVIDLTLTVRNDGREKRDFELPSAQSFDFSALLGKELVWQWSRGMFFAQVTSELTIGPGESVVFPATWNTSGFKPANYMIEGVFLGLPEAKPIADVTISKDDQAPR